MKKIKTPFILITLLLLSISEKNMAQNSSGDLAAINIKTFLPDQPENIPAEAIDLLTNKLNQITSQSSLGGSQMSQRFIITAHTNILSKDIIAGPPTMQAISIEVSFYIGDGIDGKKFSNKSITLKGVGTNELKAFIDAMKNSKPNDPAIQAFVTDGKNKIVDYYNSQCEFIINQALTFENLGKYEEAIYLLTSIPEVCKACYEEAMHTVVPIYRIYMEKQCVVLLAEARNIWNSTQDANGAAAAAKILSKINPEAMCYPDASKLSEEIGAKFKLIYEDNLTMEKLKLNAYKAIGVATGENQPNTVYNVKGWW